MIDLCKTCIVKNCIAGEVIYGTGNQVPVCAGYISNQEPLCKTCDWKYCTSQCETVTECKRYIMKGDSA